MAFLSTAPALADSDNNLLFKICQELSTRNGGAYPPREADSDNNLLYKICQLIVLGGGAIGTCAAPLVESTPSGLNVEELFSFSANGFPGAVTLTFCQTTSQGGFSLSAFPHLLSASFPNLQAVTGTNEATQFTFISNPALLNISAPALSTLKLLTIVDNPELTSLVFPSLATLTGTGTTQITGAGLKTISFPSLVSVGTSTILGNAALTSLLAPSLVSCNRGFRFDGSPLLTSVNFPNLVSVGAANGSLNGSNCSALASVSLPKYLPVNGRTQTFLGCALTQASVDHILARCVASATYVSGTVDLSGGTNSVPGTQGQLDKATLIARGCTVNTN